MDWYSRFVVSWALDQCLETAFALVAVKEAMAKAKPEIMNSDQGAQFTDPDYIKLLEGAGIRISMDGKAGLPTTFSPNASGAVSNTKKFISTNIKVPVKPGKVFLDI